VDELAAEARFAASLLAGRMPDDVEEAFAAAGLSLFPKRRESLRTSCTCPDWSNPCKHIAAVYYLLGEEFDRDPFLIFRLRGLDRDELVALLDRAMVMAPRQRSEPAARAEKPEPLPARPGAFWQGGELPDDLDGEVEPPPATGGAPGAAGPVSFLARPAAAGRGPGTALCPGGRPRHRASRPHGTADPIPLESSRRFTKPCRARGVCWKRWRPPSA
jgi:hypothetical protein